MIAIDVKGKTASVCSRVPLGNVVDITIKDTTDGDRVQIKVVNPSNFALKILRIFNKLARFIKCEFFCFDISVEPGEEAIDFVNYRASSISATTVISATCSQFKFINGYLNARTNY